VRERVPLLGDLAKEFDFAQRLAAADPPAADTGGQKPSPRLSF